MQKYDWTVPEGMIPLNHFHVVANRVVELRHRLLEQVAEHPILIDDPLLMELLGMTADTGNLLSRLSIHIEIMRRESPFLYLTFEKASDESLRAAAIER